MNEEEKRLFDEDMEKYGITFEEWIVKMEEIAEEVEREQQELINQNTRIEIEEGKVIKMSKNIEDYSIITQENIDYLESQGISQKPFNNGTSIFNDLEEEPFILLTKEELEELVPSIKSIKGE